jgi:hypothetical protein
MPGLTLFIYFYFASASWIATMTSAGMSGQKLFKVIIE